MNRLPLALLLLAAACLLGGCPTETTHLCEDDPDHPDCACWVDRDVGLDPDCECRMFGRGPDCTDGGAVDGGTADAGDGAVDTDAGPCAGACSGATPLCRESDGMCVACLADGDCTDPTAARCDTAGACMPCDDSAQCAGIAGTEICATAGDNAGACVECTEGEATACSGNPCNPLTNACSMFGTSQLTCQPCDADANCNAADERCVPMEFMGMARAGGYCLRSFGAGCSDNPYRTPTPMRESLSGAPAERYCGIAEALTTCEAVLDLAADTDCTTDDDCGALGLMDGLCRTVNGTPNKCTYACTGDSQCAAGFSCPGMMYCGFVP